MCGHFPVIERTIPGTVTVLAALAALVEYASLVLSVGGATALVTLVGSAENATFVYLCIRECRIQTHVRAA